MVNSPEAPGGMVNMLIEIIPLRAWVGAEGVLGVITKGDITDKVCLGSW